MQRTIKILTILAVMIVTAGQTWADAIGTSENPYEISNYAALKEFASLVNGGQTGVYAILTADIVCKNNLNETEYATDWVPIGNVSNPYTGTFNGQGHSITGLSNTGIAEVANSDYQGLFGYVGSGGVIKKVTLEYASITGKESVGSIVGYNQGTVSDCHVGSGVTIRIVQSNSYRIGGIVGSSYNGTVIDCTSAASFTMAANLEQCGEFGGIVGLASNSTVSDCLYLGDQIGGNYGVGAIVGNNYKGENAVAIVSNCFFTSTTFTGKAADGNDLSNANSAVGSNNGGTVTNCGLAYTVTLGDGVAFSSTENTNTVGVKYDGKFYAPQNANVTLTYTGSGFVQVTGATLAAVENQPLQRTFTMAASDVALTATAVTAPTITDVTYDGVAHAPEIQQGAPENYVIAYKLGENDVTEAKNVGTYTCTMTGLGQYIGTTTVDFDITKRSTSLAVEIVDPVTTIDGHPILISGDDAHVKVTLNPVREENETTELPKINGIATIIMTIGEVDKSYTVAIVNGEGHYYVNNLGQAAYDITATFDGDANHTESTTEDATTLEACKILTETTCIYDKTPVNESGKLMINVGETITFTINVNEVGLERPVIDSDTGKNKAYSFASSRPLSVDALCLASAQTPYDIEHDLSQNHYDTSIVNGCGIHTFSHLSAGPRSLRAIFAGNDRYTNSSSIRTDLQVNKTATTVAVEVTSPVIAK